MVASGEDGLPAPAAEVVDTVRSRAERLEHVLQHFVPLPEGVDQKLLRHRHRMRLLGRCEAARGLSEEHRAELGKPSQTDSPLFELNVLKVDGWTRNDGRWYPPKDARAPVSFTSIAVIGSDNPRAFLMDDPHLYGLFNELDSILAKEVPLLTHKLSAPGTLTTSAALLRAGLYYLFESYALEARERDPEQRERRHARRLELVGLAYAGRGLGETELEAVRPGSPLAEVLFTHEALRTDGWANSPDDRWTPPLEASEPPPRDPA